MQNLDSDKLETQDKPSKTSKKLTPLMKQYWEVKEQHPNEIVLFRMGDFYEIFYEDAIKAAPVINLTLTSRNKKSGDHTPMCGFPHHSVASPLQKLLENGFRVAICDQVENPQEAKGLVKRAVTRRLSPGMVFDPDTLDQMQGHYMMALDTDHIAFLDATTGEAFYYINDALSFESDSKFQVQHSDLNYYFEALNIVEVVVSHKEIFKQLSFPPQVCLTFFNKVSEETSASQILLNYVKSTQGEEVLNNFSEFKYIQKSAFLNISGRVFKHLEVFKNYEGDKQGSLFEAIHRTCTPAGSRKLKQWLRSPLVVQDEIFKRLEQVKNWKEDYFKLKNLRRVLKELGDFERRVIKVSSPSCNPKDLLRLADSLKTMSRLSELLDSLPSQALDKLKNAYELINKAFKEDVPAQVSAGGFIKKGFKPELDEVLSLADETQSLITEMEKQQKQATGISSLKIRYNSVFGYYIEVTKTHSSKVPSNYIRKQTLTQSERYTTEDLQALEEKVLSAKSKKLELELQEFANIRKSLMRSSKDFLNLCHHISEVDVLSSFAWLAIERNYCEPEFTQGNLELTESRHPVVEQSSQVSFRPNDIHICEAEGLLITGPNMAGKSTIMRQVALSALMAQVGSYVPASQAKLPIFEQMFTRIGASDSLSQGLSTFMVEMNETAELLSQAGNKSLVILDEIGRGTSTYDGLSLAQAILESLLSKKCMFLFSTHYQELTELNKSFSNLNNVHMGASRKDQEIVFQYLLKPGAAKKSYGIDVAKLAGVPQKVTQRAQKLLRDYESRHVSDLGQKDQMALFAEKASVDTEAFDKSPEFSELIEKIKKFPTTQKTPLEALNEIAKWQKNL